MTKRPSPHTLSAYAESLHASFADWPANRESVRRIARSLGRVAASLGETAIAEQAELVGTVDNRRAKAAVQTLLDLLNRAPDPDAEVVEVLLIEDNRTIAEFVRAVVAAPSRVVHVAETAAEGEEILRTRPIQLVLLDLILPDRDGRDLLVQLRSSPEWEAVPIIVLSGIEGPAAEAECALLGADDFMTKPVEARALRAAVTRHIMSGDQERRSNQTSPATLSQAPVPTLGPTTESASEQSGPKRIVAVEDDAVTAALIRHRLTKEGFQVVMFPDGSDAWAGMADGDFDLVILDVKVPGMDGFELLERLRGRPELDDTPIMMLSSAGSEADVVRGLGLGANDYMLKPFSPTELVARVHRQFAQSS